MRGAQVVRVLVLCTGAVDAPPPGGANGVVVRHWADPETAVLLVQRLLAEIESGVATAPAVAVEEAQAVDDASLLPDDEPEVTDEAHLVEAAPPPRKLSEANLVFDEITAEDAEFIQRVFAQVRDVDFRTSLPPPARKPPAGMDKKMQFLRDKVRELERDLARVGFIWRVKQQQFDAVDQIVDAKEGERASAVQRYQQMKDQATRAAAEHRGEVDVLTAKLNEGQAEVVALKGQVERTEQEKTALHTDFRAKIEAAQGAFNEVRGRFIAEEETGRRLQQELEDARLSISSREQTITTLQDEAAQNRGDLEERLARTQAELEAAKASVQQISARLAEREKTLAALTEEMAKNRGEREERTGELKQLLAAKDERIARLAEEVTSARAEFTQLADEYAKHRDDAGRISTDLGQAVADARAEARTAKERIADLEGELSALKGAR
ncbi:MAG: hypothetical protein HYZ27_04340 [Deltaproteobacteria bacterium]|nr:hypothetical protein [Deltaproteobacteria bacterium]